MGILVSDTKLLCHFNPLSCQVGQARQEEDFLMAMQTGPEGPTHWHPLSSIPKGPLLSQEAGC